MTTDRTNAARPAAPTDRPAAPSERRDSGNAFAALLDAHTTRRDDARARRDEPRRDEVRARREESRRDDTRHGDVYRDEVRHGEVRRDEVRHGDVRRDEVRRDDRPGHDRPAARDGSDRPAADGRDRTAATADAPARPAIGGAETPRPVTSAQPTAERVIAGLLPAPVAETASAATPVPVPAAPAAPAPVVPLPFEVAPEAYFAPAPVLSGPVASAPAPAAAEAQLAAPAPAVPTFVAALQSPPADAEVAQSGPPAPAVSAAVPREAPAEPVAAEPAAQATAPAEPATPEAPAPAPATAPARAAAEPATPAPAPSAASAPAPLSTPLSSSVAGRVGTDTAAPLHRAPAAVATLLHVAAERGITRAKMALKPAELGGIEIRLQASAAGITAQVVADSPDAARLLAQAGDDLRRALEARDVTLISLEVSTTGDERRQSAPGQWSEGDEPAAGHTGADTAAHGAEPTPTSHTVIELPGGLLVDVLA